MLIARVSAAVVAIAVAAHAQQPDLSALQAVIKDQKWKAIDPAALSAPERCRALKFMNDALDDIGAAGRAEADLLSAFIDDQELGPTFASNPPPDEPPPLTYDDAVKVSVAMLRGPLAESRYVAEFADESDAKGLAAYEKLFRTTCQRKWTEVVEAKTQVRAMARFLHDQKQTEAYQAWVPQEVERRAAAHDEAMAKRRVEQQADQQARADAAKQAQEERRAQKEQEAAARQMQQALSAAQQAEAAPAGDVVVYDDDDDVWYPAWGYGAYTNLGRNRWYAEPEYRGAAGANVERRMSSWSGGGRGGGGRGGRGGGRR